jgi:hypothetical protein
VLAGDAGQLLPPPYQLVDNEYSLLDNWPTSSSSTR